MLNQTLNFIRNGVSGCALAIVLLTSTARAVIIDGSNGNLSPPTPAALAGFNARQPQPGISTMSASAAPAGRASSISAADLGWHL